MYSTFMEQNSAFLEKLSTFMVRVVEKERKKEDESVEESVEETKNEGQGEKDSAGCSAMLNALSLD